MIFFRGDVSVYILYSFTFKIFCYEFLKIHLEIVLNKLKSSIIVFDHKISILSYNMYLTYFLFIELVKKTVIIYLISNLIIGYQPFYFHSIIEDEKSTL